MVKSPYTRFTPPARPDKTVLSVSCLAWWCKLDDCSERVQTLYFLSATVLSCRESNSHRRIGRDTKKTVLSRLTWRCELGIKDRKRQGHWSLQSMCTTDQEEEEGEEKQEKKTRRRRRRRRRRTKTRGTRKTRRKRTTRTRRKTRKQEQEEEHKEEQEEKKNKKKNKKNTKKNKKKKKKKNNNNKKKKTSCRAMIAQSTSPACVSSTAARSIQSSWARCSRKPGAS